jgi:hypothetical protein
MIALHAGLSINDQGLLIDEKTGKVINEMGATRFDVAVTGDSPCRCCRDALINSVGSANMQLDIDQ